MKTPDEIKKELERCTTYICGFPYCEGCLYGIDAEKVESDCVDALLKDALAYIRQLENHIGELTEKVKQLNQVTRERDALLELVKELGECNYCKHDSYCPHTIPDCMNCKDENCQCYSCGHQSKWQWRGAQEGE